MYDFATFTFEYDLKCVDGQNGEEDYFVWNITDINSWEDIAFIIPDNDLHDTEEEN